MTIRAPIMIEAEPSGQEPNLRVNQTRRRRKRLALATTGLVAATALVTWYAADNPTQPSLTGPGLTTHQSVDPTRPLGAVIAASGVDTVAVWAALADSRIIVDQLPTGSRVTFRYQDGHSKTLKVITLPAEEFIRRFLQHVLPHRFQKLRYYGFFRAQQRRQLEQLKASLTATAADSPLPDLAQDPDTPDQLEPALKTLLCPRCGRPMQRLTELPPQKLSSAISPPIRPP